MKQPPNTARKPYARVNAALDAALKLIAEKISGGPEHHGAALILSGLLTLAFILGGTDDSEDQ